MISFGEYLRAQGISIVVRQNIRDACLKKIRHQTREEAIAHIDSVQTAHGVDADGLEPYRCQRCLLWHVKRKNRTPDIVVIDRADSCT
jgi:hypothetical protein